MTSIHLPPSAPSDSRPVNLQVSNNLRDDIRRLEQELEHELLRIDIALPYQHVTAANNNNNAAAAAVEDTIKREGGKSNEENNNRRLRRLTSSLLSRDKNVAVLKLQLAKTIRHC